ncbi:MAG: hypothetical protein JNK77_20575 [Saprospiraceae bacterium]|nr:hypothetical protein [Saprospiraceae bacterium]
MRYIILFLLFAFSFSTAIAQSKQIQHYSFEVAPQITTVKVDVVGNYVEVTNWPGNLLMVEIKAELNGASDDILNHLFKEGRYAVEADAKEDNSIFVYTKVKERNPLKTKKGGSIIERVHYRVFIPDSFTKVNNNLWTREVEAEVPAPSEEKGN